VSCGGDGHGCGGGEECAKQVFPSITFHVDMFSKEERKGGWGLLSEAWRMSEGHIKIELFVFYDSPKRSWIYIKRKEKEETNLKKRKRKPKEGKRKRNINQHGLQKNATVQRYLVSHVEIE